MRTPTTGTLVLLGLVATLATAPVALAATTEPAPPEPTSEEPTTEPTSPYPPPSPSMHIMGDGRPQPGDEIGVAVHCPVEPRKATSPVLTIGEYERRDHPSGMDVWVAPATIDLHTVPGDYPVRAWCEREHLKWTFRVFPADSAGDDGEAAPPAVEKPSKPAGSSASQVSRVPNGAPETGGGPGELSVLGHAGNR
ncbi:hypothetical protein EIL87_06695 [Saccharopolyspora rhizosphaerae]|uniref:Uncharacterized protein n=1 Tax=Saccharopolyspora rhizosphaerae TaxID=2492662 RepID=A0A3R8Q6E6_9PSEU|nr:hypothetical protein [Saccharopolyspora rhizosphaerae]RRO17953.1 hypothetical protein EIL87_06695 [Saccharopolyspora rhizosphaerae]